MIFVRLIEWKLIISWLDALEYDKVLDVACGYGELSYKISKQFKCSVYGIDISPKLVKKATKINQELGNKKCYFYVSNAESLPFDDDFFERIVSSSALEHFKNDETALKEMKRVLKPNGNIVMTVDSLSYPLNKDLNLIHKEKFGVETYYTYQTLKGICEKVGLEITKHEYIIKSSVSSMFYNYIIIKKGMALYLTPISLIGYYICLFSDKISNDRFGYSLCVECKIIGE